MSETKEDSTPTTWVATLVFVAAVSFFWTNGQSSTGSLLDGTLLSAATSDEKVLHASHWPFSLMLTLHVINTVTHKGVFWAGDLISGCFAAYGGLMMRDVLAGNFSLPSLMENGEGLLTLYTTVWFLVNHNIPLTSINVYDRFNTLVLSKIPMFPKFMQLCSLGYNCGLLISTANSAGTASTNFLTLPALGSTVFMCVALHCAGDFFSTEGFTFNVDSCSSSCLRATCVAVWCATDALSSFPVLGGYVGTSTTALEGMFGGRASFLMTIILLNDVAGDVWTAYMGKKPHEYITDALFTATSVSQNSSQAARDGNIEREDNKLYSLENKNISMALTFATVGLTSIVYTNGDGFSGLFSLNVAKLMDGTLFTSVVSNEGVLHAAWPFSLMLTLHMFNSVQSTGGYWAADLVRCCFNACGGLMMRDLLSGKFMMPSLFDENEKLLSLVIACWYLRNHDLPFTTFNVWNWCYGCCNKWVPMDRFMNLCSVSFNCSLLLATAMGDEGSSNFVGLPTLGWTTVLCVLYHCAGQFFNEKGLAFQPSWNSDMNRAVTVAFWCGTNGLGAFPLIGGHLGGLTGMVEDRLGGRYSFLMTIILVLEIVNHEKINLSMLTDNLQNVVGVGKYTAAVAPAATTSEGDGDDAEGDGDQADTTVEMTATKTNQQTLFIALLVFPVSMVWSNSMNFNIGFSSLTDGTLLTSVTSNEKALHSTFWPFSLMLTMHVLNTASKAARSDNFIADLVNTCFATFGGLMMSDFLNGAYNMPCVFGDNESKLTLMLICWYFTNHNLPMTKINVWTVFHDAVQKFLPLDDFMSLCSTAFNCSLLINTAVGAGTAGTNFVHFPAVGAAVVLCVQLHCSGQFFSASGFRFTVSNCNANMERATWVAFWCATNGLATLPFIGGLLSGVGAMGESMFGGRANFLMSTIILDQMFGHLFQGKRPHQLFADALYTFSGIQRED